MANSNGSKPFQPDFPVVWLDDAELPPAQRPILKGLIDPGAFVLIYGPSGSGKSFFTVDMALSIATGQLWRGRRTDPCTVVYVAAEAGTSILKRFIAARDHKLGEEHEQVPLAILTKGPSLMGGTDAEKLYEQIAKLPTFSGLPIGLVIFDTLSRSMPGGDENKAEDMTKIVQVADTLREQFKCATLFVHHSGKDVLKGARGHSSLLAASDLVICIDNHVATVEKVRDGVAGERFPFRLNSVILGEDIDGDEITTCLIEEADQGKLGRNAGPTGKNQKIVYKNLKELMIEIGVQMPETSAIPNGVKAVKYADLKERCLPKFPGTEPFRVTARISEAVSSLQASGHVGVHGDFLWLA